MFTNKMGDPIPFVIVCWLLVTCWSFASSVTIRSTETDDARQQRNLRRIDFISDPEDWKPIDYGHPMRDDPTLVYVPPVVDPVHYGIHSAEPLWPVQKSKMPPFRFPPEAMLAAASIAHRWRPRSTLKVKDTVVTVARTPQQRLDRGSLLMMHHGQQQDKQQKQQSQQPEYYRYPVEATAWNGYDASANRLIGRSPALSHQPLFSLKRDHSLSRLPSQPRIRQHTLPEMMTTNRFFSGTASGGGGGGGRSFGNENIIDYGKGRSDTSISNEINGVINLDASQILSIDRTDKPDASLSINQSTESAHRNETVSESKTTTTSTATRIQRKRERGPFSPLQFIIQQGHSRVRKYGV